MVTRTANDSSAATQKVTEAANELGKATKKATAASPAAANANAEPVSLNEAIKGNPLYAIVVTDKTSSTEEKIAQIAEYLTFDPEDETANTKKVDSVSQLLEYIQSKQKNNAVKQIETVADKSSAKYQTALGEVIDGLNSYNQLLSPLQSALEVLQQRRDPGELRNFITNEKNRVDEYDKKQRELREQIEETTYAIRRAEEADRERRRGIGGFFLRMRETVGDTEATKQHKKQLAELQQQREAHEKTKPTPEELTQLKAAQDVLGVLDMGKGDSFQKTVGDAAKKALTLIDNISVTINGAEAGLLDARNQIRTLHRSNDQIAIAMTVMREGLTRSLDENNHHVEEFTALMNDPNVTDLVEKKRREIRQMGATRFVAGLSGVHNEASTGAAQAEQQKAVIVDLDRNNSEQVEGARNIKSQGIATTADKLAALLNSIAAQGSAETARAANAILTDMRNGAMKVLRRNMENTPRIYEDRNKDLVHMAETMLELRNTMDGTSNKIVEELRKRSTHVKNVNIAATDLRAETVRYTGLEHEAIIKGALPVDGDLSKATAPARPTTRPLGGGNGAESNDL